MDSADRRKAQLLAAAAGLRSSLRVPLLDPLNPDLPAGSFTIGSSLSRRERHCLAYIPEGARIDGVAVRLGLPGPTVQMHLRNARRKLGATTLPGAVAKSLVSGQLGVLSRAKTSG